MKIIRLTVIAAAFMGVSQIASAGNVTSADPIVLAREASEGPRGGDNERAGDRQRGRRLSDESQSMQLAREASEGPRGGDNERPGDRQRGRG